MRYFSYGNRGGITKVQEDIANNPTTYPSLKEVLSNIEDDFCNTLAIEDLSVKYYAYDDRLNKTVYIVLADKCGDQNYIKEYGCPQFVSFLIDLDEDLG